MQLRIKLYDLILAFSNALDQVHPALTGHHMRVGFLLDRLSERLGLSAGERERLFLAGIMHDVGVIPLKTSAEDLIFERERYLHPQAGCLFLQSCPTLAEEAERVRFHHMYWEKACDRGSAAREGSLINIADRVDVDLRAKKDFREAVENAERKVRQRRPGVYSPDHAEAMLDILHDEETLRGLAGAHRHLPGPFRRRYGDRLLEPQEIIQFSTLFGHVIDSCSPFTATHSTGVAHTAAALGRLAGIGRDDLDTLFVAGMLHDIGKLGIPLSLLEKPGKLTDEEFPKMKRHVDLSRLWLDAVPGFGLVSAWGGGHHERMDGRGYPLGLKDRELPIPARIMAIADVFTALTEDRPYRAGMTPPEALRVMEDMVKQGHLDGDLVGMLCGHADELNTVRASTQAEARQGFRALHAACAEPDALLLD
ncbi:HD domain-containing phosphohydrolase [Bilophila sp.]|uniref:HD domain-containing phosphohydrolase n=1 Tax=Bilophila sp. TaxID=1929485 RepID=UPI003077DDAE